MLESLAKFVDSNPKLTLVFLGILPGSEDSRLTKTTRGQINTYNKIMKSLAQNNAQQYKGTAHLTDKNLYLSDGYHLSQLGHQAVCNLVGSLFEKNN
jgi:lysophospholipase L1-like esterase